MPCALKAFNVKCRTELMCWAARVLSASREKASQAGVNASAYLRQTAVNAKVISHLTAEELQFVRQLIGMSVNINQVAKICHREGLYEAMQYFENYRNLIDSIIKKLKS